MIKWPRWLVRDKIQLPQWAKLKDSAGTRSGAFSACIEADPSGYTTEWFALLKVDRPDQYWLEVAYQCAKLDLQACLVGTPYDPRVAGKPVEFHFINRPGLALKNFPKGKGVNAATHGREARAHYKSVRGSLPF